MLWLIYILASSFILASASRQTEGRRYPITTKELVSPSSFPKDDLVSLGMLAMTSEWKIHRYLQEQYAIRRMLLEKPEMIDRLVKAGEQIRHDFVSGLHSKVAAHGQDQNDTGDGLWLYYAKLLDATGKVPSGLLEFNLAWLGSYLQCNAIEHETATGRYTGRYCARTLRVQLDATSALPISFGSCDFQFERLGLLASDDDQTMDNNSTCLNDPRSISRSGEIVMIVILSLIAAICVVSTLIDNYCAVSKGSWLIKMLLCFSLAANFRRLMSSPTGGQLSCVHGIRFLSTVWVVLGHTLVMGLGMISNAGRAYQMITKEFAFAGIVNATVSVDSFFVLSGMLVSYLTIGALKKSSGILNWPLFYLHRYLRLTPVYVITMFAWTYLTPTTFSGPLTSQVATSFGFTACTKYWWTNLLYINNFIPEDSTLSCFGWAWYLANDMQFFILSPIFIYLLYRWWHVGLSFSLCVAVFFITFTGLSNRKFELMPIGLYNMVALNRSAEADHASEMIYLRPYHRIPVYIVGLVLGWTLTKPLPKLFQEEHWPRWVLVLVGWSVSFVTMISVVWGIQGHNVNNTLMSYDVAALYVALSRPAWALALGWVIYACVKGMGGPVNSLLSWPGFVPLSRTCYCAYLVHLIIMACYAGIMPNTEYFSRIYFFFTFLSFLFLTYLVAVLMTLFLEAPFLQLEKLLFSGNQLGRRAKTSDNDARKSGSRSTAVVMASNGIDKVKPVNGHCTALSYVTPTDDGNVNGSYKESTAEGNIGGYLNKTESTSL